jgi:hypothetical protein
MKADWGPIVEAKSKLSSGIMEGAGFAFGLIGIIAIVVLLSAL